MREECFQFDSHAKHRKHSPEIPVFLRGCFFSMSGKDSLGLLVNNTETYLWPQNIYWTNIINKSASVSYLRGRFIICVVTICGHNLAVVYLYSGLIIF